VSDLPAYHALLQSMPRPKLPLDLSVNDLYSAMFFDKKVSGGKINFVVPAPAGMSVVKSGVPAEAVKKAIEKVFKKE